MVILWSLVVGGGKTALFSALRGILNLLMSIKIIAFDTFTGFPSVHKKDGDHDMMIKNALSTHKDHEKILENILETHEKLNPLDHIKKFKIVKGDAIKKFQDI